MPVQKRTLATLPELQFLSTGSLCLDLLLGKDQGKGLPLGAITGMWGPEGTGKSTICQIIAGKTQQLGGEVIFIDSETSIHADWAARCGMRPDTEVWIPDTMESVWASIYKRLDQKIAAFDGEGYGQDTLQLIVMDSFTAIKPRAVVDADPEKSSGGIGSQARFASDFLPGLRTRAKAAQVAIFFTAQMRMVIGPKSYATMAGGKALSYYADIIFKMAPRSAKGGSKEIVSRSANKEVAAKGLEATFKASRCKNKVTGNLIEPRQIVLYLTTQYEDAPIDSIADTIFAGDMLNVITDYTDKPRTTGGYKFKDEKLGAKFWDVHKRLAAEPSLYWDLRQEVMHVGEWPYTEASPEAGPGELLVQEE